MEEGGGGAGFSTVIARRILSVLLVAMALGQLVSFGDFVDALKTYEFGPDTLVPGVAAIAVGAEAVAGVGLWRRSAGAGVGVLALVVTIGWSVLAVQAFARGLVVPNCGCFGRFLSQELRWWVLIEDAEFVLLAGWSLYTLTRRARHGRRALPVTHHRQ